MKILTEVLSSFTNVSPCVHILAYQFLIPAELIKEKERDKRKTVTLVDFECFYIAKMKIFINLLQKCKLKGL